MHLPQVIAQKRNGNLASHAAGSHVRGAHVQKLGPETPSKIPPQGSNTQLGDAGARAEASCYARSLLLVMLRLLG